MNDNQSLYSAKSFATIFIILIHVGLPGSIGSMVTYFARFAVPLFFMISGYYSLYSKEQMNIKIINRIEKITKLAFISFFAYFTINLLLNIYRNSILDYMYTITDLGNILKFFILSWTTPYIGVGHLWFLFALIYVYLIVWVINKHDAFKQGYVISFIVILFVYILELCNANGVINLEQIYYRNAFLMGVPFFLMGHFIRKNYNNLLFDDKKLIIIVLIIIIVWGLTFGLELMINTR